MSNLQVHHTHTKVIQSGSVRGWEFGCAQCGYRARYIITNGHDMGEFEILEIGDPEARHYNASLEEAYELDQQYPEISDEADWLPIEIVEQIEAILGRFDFDY